MHLDAWSRGLLQQSPVAGPHRRLVSTSRGERIEGCSNVGHSRVFSLMSARLCIVHEFLIMFGHPGHIGSPRTTRDKSENHVFGGSQQLQQLDLRKSQHALDSSMFTGSVHSATKDCNVLHLNSHCFTCSTNFFVFRGRSQLILKQPAFWQMSIISRYLCDQSRPPPWTHSTHHWKQRWILTDL